VVNKAVYVVYSKHLKDRVQPSSLKCGGSPRPWEGGTQMRRRLRGTQPTRAGV